MTAVVNGPCSIARVGSLLAGPLVPVLAMQRPLATWACVYLCLYIVREMHAHTKVYVKVLIGQCLSNLPRLIASKHTWEMLGDADPAEGRLDFTGAHTNMSCLH